jgi:hypothetical protein
MEEVEKKGVTETPIRDEVSVVDMEAKMSSGAHEKPKLMSTTTGTPQKGKRMANVLKAVLRPAKMASPATLTISEDKVTKLKVTTSIEASLDVCNTQFVIC